MAVHNLTAEPLVVDIWKWFSIDTIPRDGTLVEVKFDNGFEARAQFSVDKIVIDKLPEDQSAKLEAWRPI